MPSTELGTFEGRDVIQVGVKLSGPATGLNDALAMKPELHEHGTEVFLVVRGRVKIGFDDIKDTDCLKRVENVVIGDAAYVSAEVASGALEEQQRMVEELRGVSRLPMGVDDPLYQAHKRGEHEAEPEFACVLCDEEHLARQEAEEEAARAERGLAGPEPKPKRRRGAAQQ